MVDLDIIILCQFGSSNACRVVGRCLEMDAIICWSNIVVAHDKMVGYVAHLIIYVCVFMHVCAFVQKKRD